MTECGEWICIAVGLCWVRIISDHTSAVVILVCEVFLRLVRL